jgi:hypothetical protein
MTTSASFQPPIDEEIIKIEEVPSSSSNNVTANSSSSVDAIDVKRDITDIRVKKEEEEVDDDEDNNHNDGTSASASNQNYDLNRPVKKEEENNDNDDDDIKITCKQMGTQCDDDYDYSDWKAGDWCWVLPADKNTQQLTSRSVKSEDGGNNTSTSTAIISVNNTITNDSSPSSVRSKTTKETKTKRATQSIDDETAPAADEASSRPKKKKRTNDDASSGNNTSNTTKQKEEYIEGRNYHRNTDVSSTVDNGVDSNSSTDDDDDDCNEHLFEESNSDKGDGYESWTKGNWCWLLPRLHSVEKINETEQQPHGLCATERTAITRSRSSRRRCRRSQSSSANVEVGGENENKLDEDYVERDDEDDNDHNSSRRTKSGRNTKDQIERWNENFQRLVTYKKKYKSTNVPRSYAEDPKLGIWVSHQRSCYNNNKLSETRVGRLDSIGFAWNPFGEKWSAMYHKLVAYKKTHISTKVPRDYMEDPELGNWVNSQRKYYKNKTLSTERIHHLESIGFAWDPLDAHWMGMYQKLVAYKKQYRSTKVPQQYTEDPHLGHWVRWQQECYRMKKLTEKRTELLNSISFVWSIRRNFCDR